MARRIPSSISPVLLAVGLALAAGVSAQGPVRTPRVHALTGARIVTAPGSVLEQGTIVIRNGVIEAVGASVAVPPDARVWDLDSLTVYAGLIDLAVEAPAPKELEAKDRPEDAGHALGTVRAEFSVADAMTLSESDRKALRGQGVLTARVLPAQGAVRGRAAVLNLGEGDLGRNLLRRHDAMVLSFKRGGGDYPGSLMGTVAVLRQTLEDARWHDRAHAVYAASPRGKERPEYNASLAALEPALAGDERMLFVTNNVLDLLRAGELGGEFDLGFEYVGSGEEYKRLPGVRLYAKRLILPVAFPKEPDVGDSGDAPEVTLQTLRAWDAAPSNPARLHEDGFTFALTSHHLKDPGAFRKQVGRAIEAGLPERTALEALTTVPAAMLDMDDRLGTIEAGKIANLVVVDGPLFAEKTKVREVWVDGARFDIEAVEPPEGDPRGTWALVSKTPQGEYPSTLRIEGELGALTGILIAMEMEIPIDITQSGTAIIVSFSGESFGMPGTFTMRLDITGETLSGTGDSPMGSFPVSGRRTEKPGADRVGGGDR